MRLVGFALPRWLHVGVRVLDTCQAHAPGAYVDDLRHAAIRDAALLVHHACTAAHETGDWLALGSWRQLLCDMVSCGWLYRNMDALLPPGGYRWHVRGWVPEQVPPGVASGVCASGGAQGAGAMVLREVAGAGGESVGGGGMAAGCGAGGRLVGAAGGGGTLHPPCDAGLLLPTCWNPLCADLAGESEAGVELRAGAGGANGWAVGGGHLYCSRECCSVHLSLLTGQQPGR